MKRLDVQSWMIHLAILMFAGVSFVVTAGGVWSLAPSEGSTDAELWWLLAILLAGGLAVGIAAISMMLFERVTAPRLLAIVILATVAALFDASFWQRIYLGVVAETTRDRVDEETRRHEYDRLAHEATGIMGRIRATLEARHLAAAQGEGQALDRVAYEEKLRPEDNLRFCGQRCLAAKEEATRHHTELEHVERQLRILNEGPTTPVSAAWNDLDRFHGKLATLMRDIAIDATLPTAPTRPRLLTEGGNAADVGGLGAMAEMLLAGNFSDKVILPLCLAAISEYTVIILVLGARPWRPCRVWLHDKIENAEDSRDWLTAEARATRGARNQRRHQQEILEQDFHNLHEQVSLRARATHAWASNRTTSANGGGHHTHQRTADQPRHNSQHKPQGGPS